MLPKQNRREKENRRWEEKNAQIKLKAIAEARHINGYEAFTCSVKKSNISDNIARRFRHKEKEISARRADNAQMKLKEIAEARPEYKEWRRHWSADIAKQKTAQPKITNTAFPNQFREPFISKRRSANNTEAAQQREPIVEQAVGSQVSTNSAETDCTSHEYEAWRKSGLRTPRSQKHVSQSITKLATQINSRNPWSLNKMSIKTSTSRDYRKTEAKANKHYLTALANPPWKPSSLNGVRE